ncbi:MAG: ABC transporter substrate-binding protein, partial [Phreatobacter sp.]
FRQGGNVPPIAARAAGRATRLVGITWTDEFQAIVSLAGGPVHETRDLAGRRFGVARRPADIVDFHRATALKGLVSALSLSDISVSDVEIVDVAVAESVLGEQDDVRLFGLKRRLPYSHEIAALLRGEVDAIFVKGTQGITVANLFALHPVIEFGFHPDPKIRINSGSPRVLTIDEVFAEHRPDLAATLVETVARAGDWARDHPDEVRRFVAREVAASEETVLAANGADLHRHLGLGLDLALIDAVGHYKDFLLEWGFLASDFSVADWVDHRPLTAALAAAA